MTEIIMCCGEAAMIFSGTSADGKPVHTVACLICGRHEISRDREIAVKKFKEGLCSTPKPKQ